VDPLERPIVIASNRGPVSYEYTDGSITAGRGGGGLVAGLGSLGDLGGVSWVAVAASEADRSVAADGPRTDVGFDISLLDIDAETKRRYYDVVSNETLWFAHHGLFDASREPRFDDDWRESWAAYRTVNERFAGAITENAPEGATVLVQDYHLSLVGRMLAERRPDLSSVHFHHTPFATHDELSMFPVDIRAEITGGLAGNVACGFHTQRWASRFTAAPTFASPLGIDADELRASASSPECEAATERLRSQIEGRSFIVRVDRIELSKNLLRGFDAYELLLERDLSVRERVVFGAYCYPSREGVPAYTTYRNEVEKRVAEINARWGTANWTPILWEAEDDYPRSLAALRLSDVLLVNPVRDGLNLVAIEGAILNDVGGSLVLSSEAGAVEQLDRWSDVISPFDISATASALSLGMTRSSTERRGMAAGRRDAALARTPQAWLTDQLNAAT